MPEVSMGAGAVHGCKSLLRLHENLYVGSAEIVTVGDEGFGGIRQLPQDGLNRADSTAVGVF